VVTWTTRQADPRHNGRDAMSPQDARSHRAAVQVATENEVGKAFAERMSMILKVVLFTAVFLSLNVEAIASAELSISRIKSDEIRLAAPRGRLSIAVIGDLHGAPPAALGDSLRSFHARDAFDAVLILGDNFETGVTSVDDPQWDAIIRELSTLRVPLLPLLGNHDYGNPQRRFGRIRRKGDPVPSAQTEFKKGGWTFPARNYVISAPFAEIIMIDSTPLALNLDRPLLGSSTAQEVVEFVQERLQRTGEGKWRIVAGHHNVSHSGLTRYRSRKTHRQMARLAPVLEESRVDLYLSAHQHHAELFKPPEGNTTHVISGLAGPRPKRAGRLHPPQEGTHFVATVARQSHAFAILEIDAESIRISFHDAGGLFPGEIYALDRRETGEEELLGGGL
jgi:predicted MPP superfamily phosphohydrolase